MLTLTWHASKTRCLNFTRVTSLHFFLFFQMYILILLSSPEIEFAMNRLFVAFLVSSSAIELVMNRVFVVFSVSSNAVELITNCIVVV